MSALEKLVSDCKAMDIPNQIATFGDAFLPDRAAEELAALKRERTEWEHNLRMNYVSMDYAIALQRAIEHHCAGKAIPDEIAKECPHHADMLNAALKAGDK